MSPSTDQEALYPSRSAAGAQLGRLVYQQVNHPIVLLGITPTGVEIAAHASKAISAPFDVVVGARVRLEQLGVIGAVAEDADAVLDPDFQPQFAIMEQLDHAIDQARRAIKTERLLFRGQRPLRTLQGAHVVVVDGHATSPWKYLASAKAILHHEPRQVYAAAAVATPVVRDRLQANRIQFLCPTLILDPSGHPRPFGDADESAARLRSIVIAREAA